MSITCMIYSCPYGSEEACKRDNIKIYMVQMWASMCTPTCERCLTRAVGYPPPAQFRPLYDYATDTYSWGKWSGQDDKTAPVWNMGGICGCSMHDLESAAQDKKIVIR
jgi:hypothetical protein